MTTAPDDLHAPLADLFREWPETACTFMENGMLCPGCPFAPFHSVADACREYGIDPDHLRDMLGARIRASRRRTPRSEA
ncbi:DUF1858 domain-containing protein [Rhodobacteraceae bacterium DSL-40]|uniref:DUF1858 domain-containing protein n=1 Tax=Amaricoccus sp. B4 TaxID=3368557 RepID=UPI000DAC0F73